MESITFVRTPLDLTFVDANLDSSRWMVIVLIRTSAWKVKIFVGLVHAAITQAAIPAIARPVMITMRTVNLVVTGRSKTRFVNLVTFKVFNSDIFQKNRASGRRLLSTPPQLLLILAQNSSEFGKTTCF